VLFGEATASGTLPLRLSAPSGAAALVSAANE